MGDAIREQYDEEKDPREEFIVQYQEESPLEIQEYSWKQWPERLWKNHFSNWEEQLFLTKAKRFKSASGKMNSICKIIKEILIPHRKGNIRLNPEFLVFDDVHIQGFLLGTDYQRMWGIDIYNSKNRHITIGSNKENKFSLEIYQVSAQDPPEELLNEFREGQFSTTLTSKKKLSLLKMLRKNRPEFAIGEEPLGRIRGHDI
ncbi:hypothetical protein O181_091234 [Austropuccinia psidii MF-1]|uniref:Uncharacterized protein n=1 Tax=Austropuccinia psidii MF-1 TaxID=1389203 RepID=A0A9Q3IWZ1_9BASI|nr:hypothetical protein [Austropuccinia psidii MF-1]